MQHLGRVLGQERGLSLILVHPCRLERGHEGWDVSGHSEFEGRDHARGQGSANVFLSGSDSKYSWLCGPYVLCGSYSTLL